MESNQFKIYNNFRFIERSRPRSSYTNHRIRILEITDCKGSAPEYGSTCVPS